MEIGHSPDEADALAITYYRNDGIVSKYGGHKPRMPKMIYENATRTSWMGG